MTPVRLEPAALRSRVKHSTTEPLRSQLDMISNYFTVTQKMLLLRGIAPTAKELTYVILWLIECGFRKL